MRILIFNWRDIKHSWAGGGEIYLFEQAKRWVKLSHSVTLFCGEDIEKRLPKTENIDGIKIYRKGGRYSLYLWAVWYYFTKFRGNVDVLIDVINGIPFFTPVFTRLPKLCFVYHIHGDQFFYEIPFPLNYLGFAVEKYIFPFFYRHIPVVSISKTTKKQLLAYGFSKNNIRIVYCGINGSSKNSGLPKRKFSRPTLLYLGRIKKYKRVDLLLEIFPQIIKKIPKAKLIIAGWGTEASNIADMVMKNPLRRRVSLVGPVTNAEKRELLSKSWLFVNPSIGEGWSIAVIEANFYGTPAVAFNVPGLAESIRDGKTGLLAEHKEDLIDKICVILKNKQLRNKFAGSAYLHARRFNWDHTAAKSLSILKGLILKSTTL